MNSFLRSSATHEPLRSIVTLSEFPQTGSLRRRDKGQAVGLAVWLTAAPIRILFDECNLFPRLSP